MLGRLDAAEARAQRIQAFAATLTFAAPVLVRTVTPSARLDSRWFYAAVVVFVLILLSGLIVRFGKRTQLPSIKVLREKWLHLSEQKFMQDMIFFAAQAFDHNHRTINRKGNVVLGMTVAFGVEVLLFVAWWAGA